MCLCVFVRTYVCIRATHTQEGHYRLWHLNKVKLLDLDGGSKKANAGAKYRLLQPLPL